MTACDEDGLAGTGAVLTIDLGAVAANYRLLRDRVAPAACAGVVKADGYGLGAERVAATLYHEGCRTFFVALLAEAIALRHTLPADAGIFVLNGLLPGTSDAFIAHRLVPVLNDLGQIAAWGERGRAEGPLPAFVHLDTGMNRLGLSPQETDRLAEDHALLEGIALRGWMSHLVSAEVADDPLSLEQRRRFADTLTRLPSAPASLANSSGIFLGRDFHCDLARPGVALYGVNPTPKAANPMRPVVRLDGRILQVRVVDSPMTVGYGATHRVAKSGKIATISAGYADGYLRSLSGRGRCVVGGREVPVVGRVSMDLITVDVTGVPDDAARPGATVELIGPAHPVDAVAAEAGTIGYEILTALGRRYARRYVGGPD